MHLTFRHFLTAGAASALALSALTLCAFGSSAPGRAARASSAPAPAGELDRSRVPSSARAVVHVDVEALAGSGFARKLKELHPEAELDFDLGQLTPMLAGVRPLREVRSVTVFTADPKSQRCGAIVRCSDKADALLELATSVAGYELVPLAGWKVHSWAVDGQGHGAGSGVAQRVWGAVVPVPSSSDRWVLLANDERWMSEGMAVLEGKGQSLAQASSGQLAALPKRGALFFAATDQPLSELGDVDPTSAVARLVQGLVLELGESNGAVFASLALAAQTPSDALRMQQVLQGLIALGSLFTEPSGATREPEPELEFFRQLAGGLSFQVSGSSLYVEFSYDLERLIGDLQALHQR